MQNTDTPPPDIAEQYASATHATNLRVEAERRSSADILIAAGWSPSRLGAALIRLHSEWDGSEHPRFDQAAGKKVYMHEMAMLLGKLKTLPEVREQLMIQADKWGCDNPKNVAGAILQWWLDRRCNTCHGTRFEVIAGTGRQSGKVCKSCRGTGEAHIPCWEPGRRMANFMDDAVNQARTQIRNRLHPRKEKA